MEICIKSAVLKCGEWSYDQIYMHYGFSSDGRFVYKWTFVSFLMIDTFYGVSRKFSPKNNEKLRIRDFSSINPSTGLLLYTHQQKTYISFMKFNFTNENYELLCPFEINEDCKEYEGNISRKMDDNTRFVIFLTRNCPGDVFLFFMLNKNDEILIEERVETEEREYCGFGYYAMDCLYFFRMAYGGGERPFEALKVIEKKENTKTQTIRFGPMKLMSRTELMHRTQIFHGNWNNGTFYLNVNIGPNQYFTTLNLLNLKWTDLILSSINFKEPRIQINEHKFLIVHDESKSNGSTARKVNTYRIPLESPETLQNLTFFQICHQNAFNLSNLQLPFHSYLQPVFNNSS